jgi:DegV family protein with EDD domain
MTIAIVTDSTCDLDASVIAGLPITILPLYINIDGRSYLDGVDLSHAEFYTGLPAYRTHPTTSAPSIGTMVDLYRRLLTEGANGIVSIHIADSLSNTGNVARLAAQAMPEVSIAVVDSGQITLGIGHIVLAAGEAAHAGANVDEIVALCADLRRRSYSFAAADTLVFLRRSGRLSRVQASLGSLLSVKPILKMHDGVADVERPRTTSRAMERLISLAAQLGPLARLSVVHGHAPAKAEQILQMARHLFPKGLEPLCSEVTPAIGAHVGPNSVGLCCLTAR